jgi:SEC-C motif
MTTDTLGRNDPCHCGSGRKYKQCHLDKDEAAAREIRAKDLAAQPAKGAEAEPAANEPAKAAPPPARHNTRQPWRGAQNTRGFQAKVSTPRKSGGGG